MIRGRVGRTVPNHQLPCANFGAHSSVTLLLLFRGTKHSAKFRTLASLVLVFLVLAFGGAFKMHSLLRRRRRTRTDFGAELRVIRAAVTTRSHGCSISARRTRAEGRKEGGKEGGPVLLRHHEEEGQLVTLFEVMKPLDCEQLVWMDRFCKLNNLTDYPCFRDISSGCCK